jgi:hypothetical protein
VSLSESWADTEGEYKNRLQTKKMESVRWWDFIKQAGMMIISVTNLIQKSYAIITKRAFLHGYDNYLREPGML